MLNIIIVSASIIAALIGAGFASGQEILSYFVVFERYGVWGLLTTVLFFAIFIFMVLNFCTKNKIGEYTDFLGIFKTHRARKIIKTITITFSLAVFSAMLSALAEVLAELIDIPVALAGLISSILAVIILLRGTDKVFELNGIIGIALVFFMTFAVLYILTWREFHTFSPIILRSATDGVVYGGYNLVTLTPVLVSLSKKLNSKSEAIGVTLTTTVITSLLIGLVFGLLSIYYNKINLGELPLLTLAKRQSPSFGVFYTFVLSFAIITTLLSSGGALIDSLAIKDKPLIICILSAIAFALSGMGFSNLINIAYRLCGIAGIVLCGATIYTIIKTEKDRQKFIL